MYKQAHAFRRILALLIITLLLTITFESLQSAKKTPIVGQAGETGFRCINVSYMLNQQRHQQCVQYGIIDAFTTVANAKSVGPIKLLVSASDDASIDSISGRYGLSLSIAALSLIVLLVFLRLKLLGNNDSTQ